MVAHLNHLNYICKHLPKHLKIPMFQDQAMLHFDLNLKTNNHLFRLQMRWL